MRRYEQDCTQPAQNRVQWCAHMNTAMTENALIAWRLSASQETPRFMKLENNYRWGRRLMLRSLAVLFNLRLTEHTFWFPWRPGMCNTDTCEHCGQETSNNPGLYCQHTRMQTDITIVCPSPQIASVAPVAIQGYQPSGFFPDCPDLIFPVRNKMNTHSGRRKVRKLYNLRNF
jgi:hypothetical protein